MNCKEVEDILVEGGEMTEAVRKHLEECASCRSLSKLMDGVMRPAPSVALDKAVLTQVKAEMRMRAKRRPAWIHVVYAAAAAVVLSECVCLHANDIFIIPVNRSRFLWRFRPC